MVLKNMSTMPSLSAQEQKIFDNFCVREKLTDQQSVQFLCYLNTLVEWNKKFNITAITDIEEVLDIHFSDSLALASYINFAEISSIADVGTGGGFPGIPLKIKFPHLNVVLIEVNLKKVSYLEHLVKTLYLDNVVISSLDWRTFLRKTEYTLDLFLARASLHPDELVRMFQDNCRYNNATLVYWASRHWQVEPKEKSFLKQEITYTVGGKVRKLVFFKKPECIPG